MRKLFKIVFVLFIPFFFSCFANSKKTFATEFSCELSSVEENEFIKSKEYKRLLELSDKIPVIEREGKEVFIYREFPNGGIDDDIYSYYILFNQEGNAKKFVFQGSKFNLISEQNLDIPEVNELKLLIGKIERKIVFKDCNCDGGTNGVILFAPKEFKPSFGFIFNCDTPVYWQSQNTNEELLSKLIKRIVLENSDTLIRN